MSWNSEHFDKIHAITDLQDILKTMNLPVNRIDKLSEANLRWLIRNIGIQNSDHEKLNEAISMIKILLK